MKYVDFTEEEKAKNFDVIAARFYEANFGEMQKPDIELMMFNFYFQKLVKQNIDEDGAIDYQEISDYKISQDLGITQKRVSNLKVKNQLKNPIEYDWKVSFSKMTQNARYDKRSGKIVVSIPDPNLRAEVEHYLETMGSCVEKQFDGKVLKIRPEYYIDLILSLEQESDREKIVKKLKREFKEAGKEEKAFDEKNIGKSLIDASLGLASLADALCGEISTGNLIGKAFLKLISSFIEEMGKDQE